jgi:hypothetical protein
MVLLLLGLYFLQQGQLVVLVEHPQALIIYDRFKNKLDSKSLEAFSAFTAFQVKQRNLTFENGITNAMHVTLDASDYYILKDKNGSMLNYKDAGRVELFQNCEILNKSYFITTDLKTTTRTNTSAILPSGSVVQAIFKTGKRVYIRLSSGLYTFVDSQKLAELKGPEKKSDAVYDVLNQHVSSTNIKLDDIYLKLKQRTNINKRAPKIHLTRSNKKIVIESPLESNNALFQELRKLLVSEQLKFSETDSTLTLWYE